MKTVGYLLFLVAAIFYVRTIKAIWQLVDESQKLKTRQRFNRFWWTPAWKVHREAYPESLLRRQIVTRFVITFLCMILAIAVLGYATIYVA
jgi:ABC-type phosphate transport system permease subunit